MHINKRSSNKKSDLFNYEFVESLIKGGADINVTDQHGHTLFHEVARSWNVDVAQFVLSQGEHKIQRVLTPVCKPKQKNRYALRT